jgi:YegS/Rv2252/BmrU family lipid kinase
LAKLKDCLLALAQNGKMAMPSSIEIIINASAGAGEKSEIVRQIKKVFAAAGIEAKIAMATSGAEIVAAAKQAARGAADVVVAGGGDGTISAVAGELIRFGKTLGALPLGTLNHFSKDLGIPQNIAAAAQVILENYSIEVDVAELNGRIFLNNSSLGLYPQIVRRRERQQRLGQSKWWAAAWATVTVFRRYPFFAARLETENQTIVRRTPFVFVGNNEYEMDFFNVGGRRSLQDGKLSVYLLHRSGRGSLIRLSLRLILGLLREARDFDAFSARQLTIETKSQKPIRVALDGETKMMHSPFCYRIRPRALRVIVPRPAAKDATEETAN